MRLIDADELKKVIYGTDFDCGDYYYNTEIIRERVCEKIDNAPTVLFPLTVKLKDNVTDEDIEVLKRLMKDYKPQLVSLETETQSEWISVKERLPENEDFVLACDNLDMFVAWYSNNSMTEGWHSFDVSFDDSTPIIAWRPLPEPYKKGGTK